MTAKYVMCTYSLNYVINVKNQYVTWLWYVCVCVCVSGCVMHACVCVMVCVYSMRRRDQNRTFNQRFCLKKLSNLLPQLISLVMTSGLHQTTAPSSLVAHVTGNASLIKAGCNIIIIIDCF